MSGECDSKRSLRGDSEGGLAAEQGQPASPAEHAAFETSAFLASIVESSNDAIVSKDLNGVITSWNQGAERMFGYEAREAIGRPITILIPPEHIQEETYILERIRRGERVAHFETVRRRKDGSVVDISLTVSPIQDAKGRIVGASKIARDISERRRAQDRLRQSEERFRVTLASIGDGVISTDENGRVVFMNAVAEKLTGWLQKDASGVALENAFEIINEVTRRPVENPVARVIQEGGVVGLGNHTILISKDGRERPIDDSAAPIRGHNGDLTGVVLVFRDATKQRVAEMTARRLAAIIENSEDAIYSIELNGVIASWNRAAERIFGYTAAEIVGQPISVIIPADRVDDELRILARIPRGDRIEHYETVRQRKDGSTVDISLTVSPLKEPASGRIVGISKIARDITEHKRMTAELAKANAEMAAHARNLEAIVAERTAELHQTVADLEAFSFTISHDLRSPLRSMQGFAHAVVTDYADKLDAQGREYLERIRNSAVRLDKLILEVLNYSRIGRGELSVSPVDLDNLIEDVMHMYPAICAADADISVERPLDSVIGNGSSLVQCVSNLLANAVKFVPAGERPKVRVWTEKRDSTVRFFVEDKGIGIPKDSLSKIFEPFQRAHPDGGYEGTGMGLAIVRKAMQRMGGGAGVEPHEGRGSTFWLELPAAR